METSLSRIINQQDALVITAMQASGVKKLERRTKHGHRYQTDHAHHDEMTTDPHIWLSVRNTIAISNHITQQLVASDPENTSRYQANLVQLTDRIEQLSRKIDADLLNNRRPFITYHDAYQYFEDEHQLNHVDSVSFDEEAGISLKHLHHIKDSIEKNDVRCLLYQSPKPDIVDTLTTNSQLAAFALDPLGLELEDENEAWFQIMLSTAATFKKCLAN
jgi:zinc transport system substrate-binding protein